MGSYLRNALQSIKESFKKNPQKRWTLRHRLGDY